MQPSPIRTRRTQPTRSSLRISEYWTHLVFVCGLWRCSQPAFRRSFALILNEPAGQVAVLVLKHAVGLVVKAWDDTSMDPNAVASQSA